MMAVDDATRLREEDPFTGELTTIVDNRLVVHRSRFEMDLNRSRANAVYLSPADAWGIKVWRSRFDPSVVRRSLAQYDAFYRMLNETLQGMLRRHPVVVVLDFHSYNHHRRGPEQPFDDPLKCPEIELGTDTMDRVYWARIVDRFMLDLRRFMLNGHQLDVRENIKFGAGWMSEWIHKKFPMRVCVISVELKKVFMDEWTGWLDERTFSDYKQAFLSTIPGLYESCQMTFENVFDEDWD